MQDDLISAERSSGSEALLAALAVQDGTHAAVGVAVDALIACLEEDQWPNSWSKSDEERLATLLIDQTGANPSPPVLHHRLVSMHTSGIAGILDKAAAQLGPILKRQMESKGLGAGGVLLLLLLRDSIDDISADQVSRLHQDWLPKFRFGDLAIPYNLMFEKHRFADNLSDVSTFVTQNAGAVLNGSALPLAHMLFADWLTKGAISSRDQEGRLAALAKQVLESNSAEVDKRAARSILTRRHKTLHRPSGALLDDQNTRALAKLESRPLQAVNAGLSVAGQYAPFLHLFRRKPKVAMCVSGQLRGFEQAVRTWRNGFLRDIDAEIFVDTWGRIGRSSAEPFRYVLPFEGGNFIRAYRKHCTDIGQDAFVLRYPTLFRTLEQTGIVDQAMLSNIFGTDHIRIDDDQQEPFRSWSNQQKMHNKIQSCFQSAFAAGGNYDLMVRIRPDKPIKMTAFSWHDMKAACVGKPILFADSPFGVHYSNLMIGDQFAVGAPEAMRCYADAAETYLPIVEEGLLNAPRELTGHVSLAQTCWLAGIDVRKVPIRFGPLLEPQKMTPVEIKVSLDADASGRMDAMDLALISANGADL